MSLIKNLIPEPEKNDEPEDKSDVESEERKRPMIKSATDLQRLRLEKLMKNPEKQVVIPEPRHSKNSAPEPPVFVRNVMGSSAGAGSGEFHVYRHLRRKEYARQKTIQIKSLNEKLDEEYQQKLEENRRVAEEKTAKKRAKRLKKKQRCKRNKKATNNKQETSDRGEETEESASEEEAPTNVEANESTSEGNVKDS